MITLKNISLKLTLIGAITLFSAATLVVVLIGAHHSMDQALIKRTKKLILKDMAVISQQLQQRNLGHDLSAVKPTVEAIGDSQGILAVDLYLSDLTPAVQYATQFDNPPRRIEFNPLLAKKSLLSNQHLFDSDLDESQIGAYYPVQLASDEGGHQVDKALLFIGYDLEADLAFAHRELTRTATLFTGIGSLGLLGMLLFFRCYVTQPLHQLASGSEKMADGHYQLRFPVTGNNEIGRLASTLNKFAATSAEYISRLQGQHKRLNDYLRSGIVGMVVLDERGKILEMNNYLTECTGFAPEQLREKTWTELLHPEDRRELYGNKRELLNAKGEEKAITVRLTDKDGATRWLECSVKYEPANHSEDGYFVVFLRDITSRRRQESRVHQLAHFDELTLLPNRRLLNEKLEQAIHSARRHEHLGAVVFIDLDFFKDVNDSLGHPVGDKLLFQVAERLKLHIRQEDTLARVGGDEFVLLAPNLPQDSEEAIDSLQQLGNRLLSEISLPYIVDGHKLHITASAGVSFFPLNGSNLQDLLRQADTAMYQAKAAGRSTLRFFSEDMQTRADERLKIRNQLQQAIDEQQFELFFQPQIQVNTGKAAGAECLIRWQHPTQGIISPADFIPIAEESGLIVDIGDWVLETACQHLHRLQQRPHEERIHYLSINISPRQFHSRDFVSRVKTLLQQYQVDPKLLCFELTENLLVDNLDIAIAIAGELKELGISFSIDDFGTGYSSLSYLAQLPLDEIKIDKSFIDEIPANRRGTTIVDTILAMAQHLGARVVAEGVETEEQLTYLQHKHCDFYQGYLGSRPLDFKQFCAFLSTSQQ